MIGSIGPRMLKLVARYADSWNAYYDDTRNSVDMVRRLREIVDAACHEAGRDPATLERTVTVLATDAQGDPWWNRLPTPYGQLALKPLSGSPEQIAEELHAYAREGIAHVQMCVDPTTPQTIEAFSRVLEILGRATGRS
jgi:alkanesulfonate monooxygenase SsuD/methylene tetrahydromethanopterin reductase-like flavin-dependent oxidoreductase (luciferase family)